MLGQSTHVCMQNRLKLKVSNDAPAVLGMVLAGQFKLAVRTAELRASRMLHKRATPLPLLSN